MLNEFILSFGMNFWQFFGIAQTQRAQSETAQTAGQEVTDSAVIVVVVDVIIVVVRIHRRQSG